VLTLTPMTLREARAYVDAMHRHLRAPVGGLFAIGLAAGEDVVGCVIVGRPLSRILADDWTCEVTRLATDGTRNAASMLYRAAWRAARAMGYRRLVTYTLQTEPGSSLRGAGFQLVGSVRSRSWHTATRPRTDSHPIALRLRWELTC
jgi:hypothetical protein